MLGYLYCYRFKVYYSFYQIAIVVKFKFLNFNNKPPLSVWKSELNNWLLIFDDIDNNTRIKE